MSAIRFRIFVSSAALLVMCCPNVAALFAQGSRVPWTTSRIVGSPDPPPPLQTVRRFPNLKFERPLLIRNDPASKRLWVVEQGGAVMSFPDDSGAAADLFVDLQKVFMQLTPHSGASGVDSVYGLAFHPQYPDVPVCWITYTLRSKTPQQHLEDGTRLSRFDVRFDESGIPRCDVASEKVVLTWLEGGHNGACLEFGPDGFLYISAGDGEVPNPPDPRDAGQDVSNLLSTVMRIDAKATGHSPLYSVPADNPFVGLENARPEIWAYGFRNPWKMTFAPDGELWLGDVGWEMYEMVHRVRKGGNGGWSITEGPQPVRPNASRGPSEILPPAIALPHTDAASVTGGYVYRGSRFPDLAGTYIFGDFETRRIWSARFDGERLISLTDLVRPALRIVAFGEDAAGELLILDYDAGTIHELQPSPSVTSVEPFPIRLSETGLFKNTLDWNPADGVIPFQINAPMWSDGARAERLLAVPGSERIEVQKGGVRRSNRMLQEHMFFPENSVLVKTISLETTGHQQIRLETQILHFDGIDWNGYSYLWRPDQRDADLSPVSGQEITLRDYGEFAAASPQSWRVHSRAECRRCHNAWVGGPLAFAVPQLNRMAADSATPQEQINQLQRLQDRGWLSGAIPDDPTTTTEDYAVALADPDDDAADVDTRARSWLSANCAHCHQNGAGGTATIDLRHTLDIAHSGLIRKPPAQGTFQLDQPALVNPGHPAGSVLLYRISTAGRGHMPHIGAVTVDPHGVALVRDWISSLGDSGNDHAASDRDLMPSEFSGTSEAMNWMMAVDEGALSDQARSQLLELARRSPPEISSLFERFQPAGFRRVLRTVIDPAKVLAIQGNPGTGQTHFAGKRMQCAVCHRIGNAGGAVGPALDDVGKRLSREQILESLLEPSKKIDPKFTTWLVQTTDGHVHSGLLISRDEREVVLRNARAEDIRLRRSDIEELQPQAISIMPEKQLIDLTDEEIAGLVEFLGGLKSGAP